MQIDLVELIKQIVGEIVLDGQSQYLAEKQNALDQFYPILLSVLHRQPQLITQFQQQLNPRLSDVFNLHPASQQRFIEDVRGEAPSAQIEQSLSQAIAPTLEVLATEAGSHDPEAIGHLLASQNENIHALLPLTVAGLTTALATQQHTAQPTPVPLSASEEVVAAEPKRGGGIWLPILGLVALLGAGGLLLKACNQKDPVANGTQSIALMQPAKFQLNTGQDGNLVTCQIFSGDSGYIDILQKEVKQLFNHNIGCGAKTDASYSQSFEDQDAIPSVLKLVKGVPNINLVWLGDQLNLEGQNKVDVEQLAAQIKPLLRDVELVINGENSLASSEPMTTASSNEDEQVKHSILQAEQALAKIKADQVNASDIASALNLQIINFATASADIPMLNQTVLDAAAGLLKQAPHVLLTVEGHTDTVGDAAANKTLSERRAKAVVNYLVRQGVDPKQLEAVGFGQEQPVADNATAEGKFRNRRIEFEVRNTETGSVRSVTEQGVVKQN